MDDIFAVRLKMLRLSRRLTLRDVGDAIECSLKTIGNLENSRIFPSVEMLLALAKFFDASTDYLVGRSEHNVRSNKNKPPDGVTLNKNYIYHKKKIDALDVQEGVSWRGVFAERLRALRLARRMTLQNIGNVVGRNLKTLGNMEKKRGIPSLSVILALADFFGVSVDYLVGWSDEPTDSQYAVDDAADESDGQNSGQKKLFGIIESLNAENIDKTLEYVGLLQEIQRREEEEKKRIEKTEPRQT